MYIEQTSTLSVPSLIADLLKGNRSLRPSQVEMALLVARAIEEGTSALLESPTGTGKTGGYLLPVLRSGKTAIISTANKALQDQIFGKDVPHAQRYVQPFGAVLVKGIGNYVCRDRLHEARKDLRMYDQYPGLGQLVARVGDTHHSFSGDFEELDFSLPLELRRMVNGDRDQCAWSKCDFYDSCFIRKMRDTAQNAQIIIVNHTLLLLDALTEGNILPERDIVIVDEAHHLADEATSVFTTSLRPTQLTSLLQLHAIQERLPQTLYTDIGQLSVRLWDRMERTPFGTATKVPFKETMPDALKLAEKLNEGADLVRRKRPADQSEKESALYDKLIKRVQNLASAMQLVFTVEQDAFVHYVERIITPNRAVPLVQVSAAPLDVAPFLKEKIFDRNPCVIMTSATLATVGPNRAKPQENGKPNFAYIRKQIGLSYESFPKIVERILPPTFDYPHNALLYVPRSTTVPEPVYGDGQHVEEYVEAVAVVMQNLVRASRGRAFLLFSSRRMLEEVYGRIAPSLASECTVLRQGSDVNRAELIRRFREEKAPVLFGLKSFWEGVDIAGEALSLVAIDKLPFQVPDDPVQEARVALMKAKGENWFGSYVLPQVVLQLKQGVGRLLRTSEDRGVMAILDSRLMSKGYGKEVLNALPAAKRTSEITEVKQFFCEVR